MASQALLFETGRGFLPDRLSVFASGANQSREIRGFLLAGIPVGAAVSHLREPAIQELLGSHGRVFADSGAFSEVEINEQGAVQIVAAIPHEEWVRRLGIYRRLAASLGKNLSVVAPDRVADQNVTLSRLRRYRSELAEIAAYGTEILIPVQNGALSPAEFYEQALSAAGLDLVPALPMKKAATSFADVVSFVRDVSPRRIHFLGMGYERRRARRLMSMLLALDAKIQISMDSNRIRAVVGEGRKMTRLEAELRDAEPDSLYAEVESDALRLAHVKLDYTDAIASPSRWATPSQLEEVAALLGLDGAKAKEFLASPDEFLQSPVDGIEGVSFIELPHVSYALDRAWERYVRGEIDVAIRTAAIRQTFADARISTHSPT